MPLRTIPFAYKSSHACQFSTCSILSSNTPSSVALAVKLTRLLYNVASSLLRHKSSRISASRPARLLKIPYLFLHYYFLRYWFLYCSFLFAFFSLLFSVLNMDITFHVTAKRNMPDLFVRTFCLVSSVTPRPALYVFSRGRPTRTNIPS